MLKGRIPSLILILQQDIFSSNTEMVRQFLTERVSSYQKRVQSRRRESHTVPAYRGT